MKRSLTTTTAIALALGTAAVVAPISHAEEHGLRGKDGTGIIALDEQMESDLDAGSCTVEAGGRDAKSGSQAGFNWNTLEPNAESPDKTLWGLSVAFDGSKERTFADWGFSNSGNLKDVLDADTVPSMGAGQTFIGKDVTHKADEIIEITASNRDLRSLNLYADLTGEKVKQFASATADNPVRYAWQSNYKQDNPYAPYITQGDSATFTATVNPWPSENIECNPITATWDKIENHVTTSGNETHVIEPGEETKVGHINVPELSDGTVDDSLTRMVVEAYSDDGKFIGTSDPDADSQQLRIADNGDVFFTWPDYRDPENGLADGRSVVFSAIAKPRSDEQLQQAVEHNTEEYGSAFESSNILPRYNTPNEVDNHTISLDDTEYHDPQYEKPNRSIISGIIDGAPSNKRKELVYTQVGDLIREMIEHKGEPNLRATVRLDQKYVYPGWDAAFVDEENGNYDVRVTAPANPAPGTFAQPVVEVTYSNGSTDRIEIMTVVDPNHTQQMNLAYKQVPVATPGEARTIDTVLTRAIGDGDNIEPAQYTIDTSTLPDGWQATVDQSTGQVTVTPSEDAPNGEQFTGEVTATYPDGTADTAEVNVTAVTAVKTAKYDAETVSPGMPVELAPIIADRDAAGGTDGPAPTKYTFADGALTTEQDGVQLTIDPDTGVITAEAGDAVTNGTHVRVPVEMSFPVGPTQTTDAEVVTVVAPTRPVPFEVETIFDDTVPAGEARVTREGAQGVEAIQPDGTWKVTSDPVNAQVTVGTKPTTASATQTWTLPVPFDTERRANPELKPGETRVVQEGVAGERSLTVNVTATGEAVEIAPETETREPVTEIIEYGPDNEDRESITTRKVPFTTKIVYDPELPEGASQVDQEGKDGTVTTTATQKVVDGKPQGDPVITEDVTDPVEMIVRVGTGKVTTDVVTEVEQPIPAPTRVVYDPELTAGEHVVDSEGANGSKIVTVTHEVVGGEATDPSISERVTKKPAERIVRVGTKPADPIAAPDTLRWEVPLPYPTELRENPDLAPGEVREVRAGKEGTATFAASFAVEGTDTRTVTEEDRTEPVARVVEYGPRGKDAPAVDTVERAIEFDTRVVEDPSLPAGKQVIEQGEFGAERVTITREVTDGVVGEPVETVERLRDPKDAVIRVGTGEVDPVDADVTIPFGTRIVYDPTLEPGQEVEDVAGENGAARVRFADGAASLDVVRAAVDRVVRVGSKPAETVEWTERIPFGVEVRENDQRPAGEHTIVRDGEEGTRVHSGGTATDVKQPVDMVIEVGTKQAETPESEPVVTDVDLPYTTRIVYDPTLEPGQEVEDVAGQDGRIRVTAQDGESTTEQVRPMIQRVVRVGTKPAEAAEWTERVPFEVEVRENPDRKQGTHEIVREGVPGTVAHVGGESTTVTEPVNMVIEVGTKEPTAPTTPVTEPEDVSGSSDTAKRCVANATAINSPLMWLLPVALLGGIGYGVNEAFGPQIAQVQAQFNEAVRRNTPDFGIGIGIGISEPEWARELRMQADAVGRQFAGMGDELRPLGMVLGAVAAVAATGGLLYQACQPDGFDEWFGEPAASSKN